VQLWKNSSPKETKKVIYERDELEMKSITLDCSNTSQILSSMELEELLEENRSLIENILSPVKEKNDVLGWVDIDTVANEELLASIEEKAKEIREKADVFVLIGVGGSNQGARAVIEAMGDNKVKILYSGNTLSSNSMNKVLEQLKGKSVYINVIAKNFATLEPGISFRVIRHYMEEVYGQEEAAKRTIVTGSLNNSNLHQLGLTKGYTLFPFPLEVGGRFSVLSAVGLLPIAVAGINIRELLNGARDIKRRIHEEALETNGAVNYALYRNILLKKGYSVEILSYFEPMIGYFSKWWVQLFGESEGKNGKGIFPAACSFSEDLHSLGQYIQEGQKIVMETFLNIEDPGTSCRIPHEEDNQDGFAYIDDKDFAHLNQTAYEATVKAHSVGGVPCMIINVPELTPYYMGQLFYYFEYACYLSASILGVDPFDQPGVEAYKLNLFQGLGK
jgi:glucose-6-phosphate isomerase